MSYGDHIHGDPGLECTIWDCRFPQSRFLCSARLTDGSYCVLLVVTLVPEGNENRVSLEPGVDEELLARQKETADAILLERAMRVIERRYPRDLKTDATLAAVHHTLRHMAVQLREGWGVHARG